MPVWHVAASLGGHGRVLVLKAESAAAVRAQLRAHWAAGRADRTLIRAYRTADGGTLYLRWGRLAVTELHSAKRPVVR